jgi:NADH-ubiquinone oxidoreductase chain 1
MLVCYLLFANLKLINLIPIIVCVIFVVIFFVILDRFIMGSVQRRSGPYIVGWFGLLQSVDDGIKLYLNRVIIVQRANGLIFIISPLLFFTSSYLL